MDKPKRQETNPKTMATRNRMSVDQSNQLFRSISSSSRNQQVTLKRQLGDKDLIIRMLAEVFQVHRSFDGQQMRWEQVSSSLVPVSLYSRSTNKWLNYLLSASSMAAQVSDQPSSCAMSPDSRDFLLLLQQFHQQNRSGRLGVSNQSAKMIPEASMDQYENCIVFQVVAHDYFEGQCRKILNVKLAQPGTRLGQASEYFVYWKEPLIQAQQSIDSRHRRQFVASSTPLRYSSAGGSQQHITWGLNFASINDAKLFYDICSLNLVDLDFNSDYFKQFMRTTDRNNNKFDVYQQQLPLNILNQVNQRQLQRAIRKTNQLDEGHQDQDEKFHKQQSLIKSRSSFRETDRLKQQTLLMDGEANKKCQSCLQDLAQQDCPVHAKQMRSRSKSTSRQRTNDEALQFYSDNQAGSGRAKSGRSQSFSTPASPEHQSRLHQRDPECPVHSEKVSKAGELGSSHHPRCLSYIRQQHEQSLAQSIDSENKISSLQDAQAQGNDINWPLDDQLKRGPPVPQNSISSTQSLHSKRVSKTRYMGHLMGRAQQQQQRYASKESALDSRIELAGGAEQEAGPNRYEADWCQPEGAKALSPIDHRPSEDLDRAAKFILGKAAQRRSTACETSGLNKLYGGNSSPGAHRHARLARAQYANSKNMKDFLSLDAGGCQQPARNVVQKKPETHQPTGGQQTIRANPSAEAVADDGDDDVGKEEEEEKTSPVAAGDAATSDWLQQTVGTTTEDLPLDPALRKRMFRLASEEAISERTEPRSSSTNQTTTMIGAEKRSVSLGPGGRGMPSDRRTTSRPQQLAIGAQQRARSDASRRRSLERTMCVDLELEANCNNNIGGNNNNSSNNDNDNGTLRGQAAATLPPSSSFRKTFCLSPLPQSSKSSPSVCLEAAGGNGSSSFRLTRSSTAQNRCASRSTPDVSQLPGGFCCPDLMAPLSGRPHPVQPLQQQQQQQQQGGSYAIPLASGCACHHGARLWRNPQLLETTRQDLAADDQLLHLRASRMRQSRSCPSSLRRKRTPQQQPRGYSSHHYQSQAQSQSQHYHQRSLHATTAASNRMQEHWNECQCQVCPRMGGANQMKRPSSAMSEQLHHHARQLLDPNPYPFCQATDLVCARDDTSGRSRAFVGTQLAPGPSACMNNVSSLESAQIYSDSGVQFVETRQKAPCEARSRYCLAGGLPRRQQASVAGYYRPCSSLSSRSPLHYGLYESDPEDENEDANANGLEVEIEHEDGPHDHEDPDQGWPNTCPFDVQPLHLAGQVGCFGSSGLEATVNPHHHHYHRGLPQHPHRHQHHHHHHPIHQRHHHHDQAQAGTALLKPVQGYDQTMARSSLKCRQRARSQPPPDSQRRLIATNTDCRVAEDKQHLHHDFHLNKSMENVQKLIREVQNELDALRPCTATTSGSGLKCSFPVNPNDTPSGGVQTSVIVSKRQKAENQSAASSKSTLQPYVSFDWRLIAERGLRCYGHFHRANNEAKTVASCELNFLQKMSRDEENVSLEPNRSAKVSLSSATRPAGQFKCVGAIRKAGFLSVKKWILKRKQSIELARKQGWKRYWVCLRGTTLLFYSVINRKDLSDEEASNRTCLLAWVQANCANQCHLPGSSSTEPLSQCYIEKEPRHLIIIEGAIAQPIPEHPKRDFVFCLSTTFGDAYLFQSACQLESDNWISAIHNACAASIARDLTRDEAVKLFENKIRHLEIEAEKKLFLRQRLESRLTSMSSMGHSLVDYQVDVDRDLKEDNTKRTMRSLLFRLNQQLLALDTYIERVHCEMYQLRCYIASCGNQRIFYQQHWVQQQSNEASLNQQQFSKQSHFRLAADLPHPKALLTFVSRSTKLILINLGVFTVSSFHAYIHACQGSAETILQRIQRHSSSEQSPTVELRVRSRSLSEQMLSNRLSDNVQLETEKLIDLSNFRQITIKLSKSLYDKIKSSSSISYDGDAPDSTIDDDRYSVQDNGESISISMRVHPSSNTLKIIKQLLNYIEPKLPEMYFLNYYLRFEEHHNSKANKRDYDDDDDDGTEVGDANGDLGRGRGRDNVAKRAETVEDWSTRLHSLELVEKIVFRLDLSRSLTENEALPFGISIGVQLFEGRIESLLNVHCSYIEWGSVAEKAGLKDEDELLMINGVPVMDLDMMFVESLIQDDTKLRLVVRSSRVEPPSDAIALGLDNWRSPPSPTGGFNNQEDKEYGDHSKDTNRLQQSMISSSGQTQIISDEYISSLVCPPPPNKSSAFVRNDSTLLRQKSDMTDVKRSQMSMIKQVERDTDADETRILSSDQSQMVRAKSQHNIDSSLMIENDLMIAATAKNHLSAEVLTSELPAIGQKVASNMASQLMRKTEQLTRLLGKTIVDDDRATIEDVSGTDLTKSKLSDKNGNANALERLRKSILELIETEFAYIRHLETIIEHYMSPLREMSFLNIADLRHLNDIVSNMIDFQREFFKKLANGFTSSPIDTRSKSKQLDEYEELNRLEQSLDSIKSLGEFKQILKLIGQTFLDEWEKFKIYSAYCVAYSKLQRLLHPKRASRVTSASVLARPNALDTFLLTNGPSLQTSFGSGHPAYSGTGSSRDFLRPLGSFMNTTASIVANNHNNEAANSNESKSQLKQLNEFLGHLDSSSSSVSLSLPKSSGSGNHRSSSSKKQLDAPVVSSSSASLAATTFQRSAHQQSFESYLIKPIQRIVKYPMLLNSIAVSVAQAYGGNDDGLHEDLQRAVKQMESMTSHVNDTQRVHDEFGSIFELIERQFIKQLAGSNCNQKPPVMVGPHQPTIGLGIDQLLYFGQVDWLNMIEFNAKMKRLSSSALTNHLFVFNSCVVFVCKELMGKSSASLAGENNNTKSKKLSYSMSSFNRHSPRPMSSESTEIIRYQSLIPVSEVQVRSVPVSNDSLQQSRLGQRHRYQWELFRCSSVNSNSSLLTKTNRRVPSSSTNDGRVYLLASPTNEARNMFLRKIRHIIRDSVRNMSLPLNRSPSSKSSSPIKKLSSSSNTNTNSSCSQSTSLSPVSNQRIDYIVDRDESNYVTSIEVNN